MEPFERHLREHFKTHEVLSLVPVIDNKNARLDLIHQLHIQLSTTLGIHYLTWICLHGEDVESSLNYMSHTKQFMHTWYVNILYLCVCCLAVCVYVYGATRLSIYLQERIRCCFSYRTPNYSLGRCLTLSSFLSTFPIVESAYKMIINIAVDWWLSP